MSKPKWHEAWQDAIDEGAEPAQKPTQESKPKKKVKKAIAVRRKKDGTTEILKTVTGVEAEKMIADAHSKGMKVEQRASQVESLMKEQNGATDVPPEIYQIMSAVIDFAQELNAEWKGRNEESLLDDDLSLPTEMEYTMDDVPPVT